MSNVPEDPWGEHDTQVVHPNSAQFDDQVAIETWLQRAVEGIGGSHRDGQETMARLVVEAIQSGKHLLVQAGTGTGKSLAYLVPAVVRAAKVSQSQASGRTIVATATLALQRQLIENDLPRLMAALAEYLPRKVTYAVLKGKANFVCLEKFHRPVPDLDEGAVLFETSRSALGQQAKRLRSWVEQTHTGDRDDFPEQVDSRLWRSLSVTGRECVGPSKCAWGSDCFAERAKRVAVESDIVVTNHAMLAINFDDEMSLLPDHEVMVVDEAHELVDRTTSSLSGSLDANSIERAANLAKPFISQDLFGQLIELADSMTRTLESLEMHNAVMRLDPVPTIVREDLQTLERLFGQVYAGLQSASEDEPDVAAQKARAKGYLTEAMAATHVLGSSDADTVRWLDVTRSPTLHHAPLSVADFLSEALFLDRTVVLTSATLQVGGSMEATAGGVGLVDSKRWSAADVGSPFDFAKQGILYCAAHLPSPAAGISEEMLTTLAQLIDAAGGRTLSLFSSWRAVDAAAEHLEHYFSRRTDRPILVAQPSQPIVELIKAFKADPQASLLGTMALWQGIDVPGNTCTLVTIDRIPFPRPDDPVMSARSAKADQLGMSGFGTVSLPRAAILLAQGVGRLIRSSQDRGVVAVLDSRLATARYGASLRASLPNLWWTTETELVMESLKRLNLSAQTSESNVSDFTQD